MTLRDTTGDTRELERLMETNRDSERPMGTHETQRDYWTFMKPMGTHMILRQTTGDS